MAAGPTRRRVATVGTERPHLAEWQRRGWWAVRGTRCA